MNHCFKRTLNKYGRSNAQVVIVDSHPLEDSRIIRHMKLITEHEFDTYRVNFNRSMDDSQSGIVTNTMVPTYVIGSASKNSRIDSIQYNIKKMFMNKRDLVTTLSHLAINVRKPSIIHVHDPALLIFALSLSKQFHLVRIVYDRHEVYESPMRISSFLPLPKIARIYETLASKRIDGVVTVLDEYQSRVEALFPNSRTAVVPNFPLDNDYDDMPIKAKIDNISSADKVKFVYIGSLNWEYDRDIALIMDLARSLLSRGYKVQFIIGGATTDELLISELSSLNNTYPEDFIYAGYLGRDEVIRITQDAHFGFLLIRPDTDYWVLTSPNKIFEYLRCGTIPIIRANCTQRQQLESCSLWFEREDSREFIQSSIESLICNADKMHDMLLKAYQLGQSYTFESIASNYINLYDNLLMSADGNIRLSS